MMRRIELLPATYLERQRERRTRGIIIVAGIVVLALLFVWWLLLGFQISDAEDELAAVQARNAQLEQQIAELQRFADLDAEVTAKRTALQSVMAGDVDWPSIMTEIAMVLPGEIWLTDMQASAGVTEGASPVGTETAPVQLSQDEAFARISFNGNSLSMPGVARWLIRLGTVREFEAIFLNDASESEIGEVTTFTFTNTIEMNNRAASERFQGEFE
ncbi:MAG: PilN domain-containing protein [Actinomycetota bacterium]